MKSSVFFSFYVWIYLFVGSTIASEWKNISVGGSYTQSNLICNIFNIGDSCTTGEVEAEQGAVGDSMTATRIFITDYLSVGDSLTCHGLFKTKKFDVGDGCKQGTVVNSMTATQIIITNFLKVGDSLKAEHIICKNNLDVGDKLEINKMECTTFKVGGETDAHEIYAKEATVHGSMCIKEKAHFTKKLFVGGLLNCIEMTNDGSTEVGGIIKAQKSIFKDISINSTVIRTFNKSTVTYLFSFSALFYAIFYPIWRYFFGGNQIALNVADEKSEFENCKIESMLINKNNNAKQIIELKNTQVSDKIVFAPDTKGEVWMYGNSQVGNTQIPNVQNGTVFYK
jgi:phage pi2 protein 07